MFSSVPMESKSTCELRAARVSDLQQPAGEGFRTQLKNILLLVG